VRLETRRLVERSLNYAYPRPEGDIFFRADLGSLRPAVGRRAFRSLAVKYLRFKILFVKRASRLPVAGSLGRREKKTSPSGAGV